MILMIFFLFLYPFYLFFCIIYLFLDCFTSLHFPLHSATDFDFLTVFCALRVSLIHSFFFVLLWIPLFFFFTFIFRLCFHLFLPVFLFSPSPYHLFLFPFSFLHILSSLLFHRSLFTLSFLPSPSILLSNMLVLCIFLPMLIYLLTTLPLSICTCLSNCVSINLPHEGTGLKEGTKG